MDIITPEDMVIADENSTYLGVPRILLMENAGRAISDFIKDRFKDLFKKNVIVFAGIGNNGGDGFVCARHLSNQTNVTVILLAKRENIKTAEALRNWKILEKMKLTVKLFEISNIDLLLNFEKEIQKSDIIVDAIFGTGVKGKISEPFSSAIQMINSSKSYKVSIDVPSGLDPLNGNVFDKCVFANATITLHKLKSGLIDKKEFTGDIKVSPIGLPLEAEFIVGPGDLRYSIKPRYKFSKKGDFGRLLVIGGSKNYSGAPTLSALAALKTGADLVIVASPKSVAPIIQSFSPNLIVRSVGNNHLQLNDLAELKKLTKHCSGIIIGPGLGLEEETKDLIIHFLNEIEKNIPLVLDADALKAVSKELSCLRGHSIILTPHRGEFEIITNKKIDVLDPLNENIEKVKSEAQKLGIVILLKGSEDIISDGEVYKINLTGNPGMTTGGTGDVLAGIIGTLIGWDIKPFRAACAGAFISGLAGDLAVKDKGYHIVATDVVDKIFEVMKRYDITI